MLKIQILEVTSLVRAGDLSSSANPPVRYCHFGISPVNYSDSANTVHYEPFHQDPQCMQIKLLLSLGQS